MFCQLIETNVAGRIHSHTSCFACYWQSKAQEMSYQEMLAHLPLFSCEPTQAFVSLLVCLGIQKLPCCLSVKEEMVIQSGHSHSSQVLIVGGGDGGILREVVKHSCVEKVCKVGRCLTQEH